MSNIIELKNINKIYGKRIKSNVLSNINISIESGSFNSVIGASGSGKTTLLRILAGLENATGTLKIDNEYWLNEKYSKIMLIFHLSLRKNADLIIKLV